MKQAQVRNKKELCREQRNGQPIVIYDTTGKWQVPYSMMKNAYHKQSSKFFAKFHHCTTCMAASMKNIKTPRTLKRQKEDV